MQRYRNTIVDAVGAPLAGVSVTVRLAGTTTAAPIYSDAAGTAKANPFICDANGSFEFYAANGRYTLLLSKAGVTFDADDTVDLVLHDPAIGVNTTPGSTPASLVETDLSTLSLRAYQLNVNGQTILLEAAGVTAANTNEKTVRLKWGATTLLTLVVAPGAAAAKAWWIRARVTRTGAAAQHAVAMGGFDGSSLVVVTTAPTADLTQAVTAKVTGQNGVAQAGDITSQVLVATEG